MFSESAAAISNLKELRRKNQTRRLRAIDGSSVIFERFKAKAL